MGFSRQEHWSGLPFLSPIERPTQLQKGSCCKKRQWGLCSLMQFKRPIWFIYNKTRLPRWSCRLLQAARERSCPTGWSGWILRGTEPIKGKKKVWKGLACTGAHACGQTGSSSFQRLWGSFARPETLRLGGEGWGHISSWVRGPHNLHVRPHSGRTGPEGKWSMHGMTGALSAPPGGQHTLWMD